MNMNISLIQSEKIRSLIMWLFAIGAFYSPFVFPALLLVSSVYLAKSKRNMSSAMELSLVRLELEEDC